MPKPLFSKLVVHGTIGFFCVLFGCVYGLYSKDKILLMMSLAIGLCSVIRIFTLLKIIRSKSYHTLTGTCTKCESTLFRKNQQIYFCTTEGKEYQFTLDKHVKLQKGHYYCLYFQKTPYREKFQDLSSNLLGFEDLSSLEDLL